MDYPYSLLEILFAVVQAEHSLPTLSAVSHLFSYPACTCHFDMNWDAMWKHLFTQNRRATSLFLVTSTYEGQQIHLSCSQVWKLWFLQLLPIFSLSDALEMDQDSMSYQVRQQRGWVALAWRMEQENWGGRKYGTRAEVRVTLIEENNWQWWPRSQKCNRQWKEQTLGRLTRLNCTGEYWDLQAAVQPAVNAPCGRSRNPRVMDFSVSCLNFVKKFAPSLDMLVIF